MVLPTKSTRIGAAILGVATVGALLAGCVGGPTTEPTSGSTDVSEEIAAMDPISLTFSEPFPPTNANNHGSKLFMEYVTKATNGKVTFDLYDSATLHSLPEAMSAIESGLSDITLYIPGLAASDVPGGAWATGLAAFAPATPLDMLAASPAATAAFSGSITEELAANNAVLLGNWVSDSYSLLCTSPVATLADAHGKLGRSSGGTYNAEMEALGMIPTLVDGNEVFEALQRGTVNCQVGALSTFLSSGLANVAKYYTPLAFSPNVGPGYIMGKDKYDALPDAVKGIFAEAGPLLGIGTNQKTLASYLEWYTTAKDKFGLTFVAPAKDLTSALANVRASRGATLAERAPEGTTDKQELGDRFRATNDEWLAKITDKYNVPVPDGSTESMVATLKYIETNFDWDAYRQEYYEYIKDLNLR